MGQVQEVDDFATAFAKAAPEEPGQIKGSVVKPSDFQEQGKEDDFATAFKNAEPSQPVGNAADFARGVGQSASTGLQSIIAGIPGTAKAISDKLSSFAGGPFTDQPVYDANGQLVAVGTSNPVGQLAKALAPAPLAPAQSGAEEAGRFVGGVLPWAAAGAVAPELLPALGGSQALGAKYQELRSQGVPVGQAFDAALGHGEIAATTFALMPAFSKVLEARVQQPFMQEAAQALSTGSLFAAQQVLENAVDKIRDPELEYFTGFMGAEGKGIMLHFLLRGAGALAAGMPKEAKPQGETPNAQVQDLTGGFPGVQRLTGEVPAPEGAQEPNVQPVLGEAQAAAPVGAGAEAGAGRGVPAASVEGGGVAPEQGREVVGGEARNQSDLATQQPAPPQEPAAEPSQGSTPGEKGNGGEQESKRLEAVQIAQHGSLEEKIANPLIREHLQTIAEEAGSGRESGGVIREGSEQGSDAGRVTGIAQSVATPKSSWWNDRPGNMTEAEIKKVVERATSDTPGKFTDRQREMLEFLINRTPDVGSPLEPPPAQPDRSPTSIKNAAVEKQLRAMNLEPPEKEKTTFAAEYTKAKATFDADPFAGQVLVKDLFENNRPPTKEEGALLALEANRRIVERENAEQALVDNPGDPSARARVAAATDAYNQLADVTERAGTESSWSLQIRKMMIARDYSLAAMERRASVTENGGEPLSETQRAEIKDLHDRIHKTQAALDEYVKKTEAERAAEASKRATEDLKREVRARKPTAEKPVRDYISKKAEEAKEFYRKGGTMLRGGFSPITFEDVSRISYIAADYIAKGADAAVELTKDFGERIQPHLEAILARAREIVNVDKPLGRIEERLKEGAKLADVRPYVEKIAKHVLAENPTLEREGLAGRVHKILKPVVPDLTHEQARDLISGYGEYRQASKDELSKRLRDLKGQMQQVAKLEALTERGEAPAKTGFERREPSQEERRLIKEVNDAKRRLGINPRDADAQAKSKLQALKTRWANETKDIQAKIDAGDFSPRPKSQPVTLDPEAQRLQAEHERVVNEYKARKVTADKSGRPTLHKGLDYIVNLGRAFKLSAPPTILKLGAAAAQRVASTPLEEMTGQVLGALPGLSDVAAGAPREGGANAGALGRSIAYAWTHTIEQAGKALKTGKWDLDLVHGKGTPEPPELLGFFGRVHKALKTPAFLNEFALSAEKRNTWAIANGLDPSNQVLQLNIGLDAYKDAQRAVFQQDSRVNDAYNWAINALERPSKIESKGLRATSELGGKVTAAGIKTLFPFVKVGSNIVGEALTYATGTVSGSAKLAEAVYRGTENLTAAEKDQIMRHLKKGSLGAALLYLGYTNPKMFGGFYRPGQQEDADVKYGSMKLAGVNIPAYALHSSIALVPQIGATARRIADSYLHKRDSEPQGLGAGVMAGALGLLEQAPLIDESAQVLGAITDPSKRPGFVGRTVEGQVIPSGVQWIARQADTNAKGDVVKRNPKTVAEHVQEGIPGLRQKLPVKQ